MSGDAATGGLRDYIEVAEQLRDALDSLPVLQARHDAESMWLLTTEQVRRLLADRQAVQRVRNLAVQYKRLGEELHDVPRARSFADAALDLSRALGEDS